MKWPLLSNYDSSTFPTDQSCACCGGVLPHNASQIVLSGAALVIDDEGDMVDPDGQIELYLGATAREVVCGAEVARHHVDIVSELKGGQFEIYFCSSACLRTFFLRFVDALERRD